MLLAQLLTQFVIVRGLFFVCFPHEFYAGNTDLLFMTKKRCYANQSTLVIPALPFLSASVGRSTSKKLVLADQAAEQHCSVAVGKEADPSRNLGRLVLG